MVNGMCAIYYYYYYHLASYVSTVLGLFTMRFVGFLMRTLQMQHEFLFYAAHMISWAFIPETYDKNPILAAS